MQGQLSRESSSGRTGSRHVRGGQSTPTLNLQSELKPERQGGRARTLNWKWWVLLLLPPRSTPKKMALSLPMCLDRVNALAASDTGRMPL